jgi:TorA maturation chaperone TorD
MSLDMTPEAAVAQLAASLLAHEIDASLLASLQQPETALILQKIEPRVASLLDKEWTPQDFEDAAVEYCRLFILDPVAPARAAAYDEKNSLEVAGRIQFMLDSGFLELPKRFKSLAPDHVALLLLVYSTLLGDDSIQFKSENLAWLPDFSARLENECKHPLYLLAAKILRVV